MLLLSIPTIGTECKCSGGVLACVVADCDADFRQFVLHIRIDLNVAYPYSVCGLQFNPADYAVPVRLGVVGDRVGIYSNVIFNRVVHTNGQQMLTGRHNIAEVVQVWCTQTILHLWQSHTDSNTIHPNSCFPVTAFQQQDDSLASPVIRDMDLSLIPGRPCVMF